jgi:HNH endonuclease/RuvA, C-terminal domain
MRGEAASDGEAADEAEAAPTWAPAQGPEANPDWHTVDRALRAIAQRRAALDADEAAWLRQAEALQIWRPLGMVSAIDYLERVLGYAPRTAQDRLRVARALGSLPQLTAALTRGELGFSAVRELTRVATPATEASWTAAALGKNLRQIEELVADHRPGDRPDDPADPEAHTHVVRFELSAETFALLRQARTILDDEHGEHLPDDGFVAALCGTVLDGASTAEPTGRAKFQIAVTVCERCQQGWQEGAGAKLAIRPAAVERALCDAQHLGSLDGDAPERAHQDIPPSVARFVWRRDGGRCRLPGCRSARGLELHHLVHRADGGSHDASNLVLACSACHQAHHAGALTISGTADHLEVHRRAKLHVSAPATPPPVAPTDAHVGAATEPSHVTTTGAHVGAVSKLDAAVLRAQTKDALVGLGWKPAIACAAVTAASTVMGPEMTLERLIFEALRQCPGGKRDGRTSPRAP